MLNNNFSYNYTFFTKNQNSQENKLEKNKIFFTKMISYRKIHCDEDIILKNSKYCLELILEKKDYTIDNNYNLLRKTDLLNGFIKCLNILR